jgi:hypothetical protein
MKSFPKVGASFRPLNAGGDAAARRPYLWGICQMHTPPCRSLVSFNGQTGDLAARTKKRGDVR